MKKVLIVLGLFVLGLFMGGVVHAEDEAPEETPTEEKEAVEVDEIIKGVVNALNEEKDKDFGELLQDFFSGETITVIVALISLVIGLLGAINKIKNLKIDKELTLEKVKDLLSKENAETLQKGLEDLVKPMAEQVSNILPVLETFSKVLALSQENTPTSRLAVLELLSGLKQVDAEVVENAKQEIETQVEQAEIKKEQIIEELKEIEMPVE